MVCLEELRFDNTVLQQLPLDDSQQQGTRQVRGAVYSLVEPTPLREPRLVAVSADALALLGLDPSEAERPEFTEVMAGNRVLTQQGSRAAAHCYCGYQFGFFAGQLGDGAAIYLGEVVDPSNNTRQELQLKGAGLTPFSRQADGRKVLRSSMREFLASEAMDALGIPTTRAGSLVVSGKDTVLRDVTYSGNAAHEPCAVVSRIAPTFIRFGSFEICKPPDAQTGRAGPSAGLSGQLLLPLVGYVVKHHHPDIWQYYGGREDVSLSGMSGTQVKDMVETWYTEVCRRTARLAAAWQGVGFVHGVLNTDNMSITGLTLDYGPYGFMDRFDSQHVSNGSDDGARYTYEAQPGICRWNCERLAEALASIPLPTAAAAAAAAAGGGGSSEEDPAAAAGVEGAAAAAAAGSILPGAASRKALALYDDEYVRMYRAIMRRKLGLLGKPAAAAAAAAVSSAGPSSSAGTSAAAAAAAAAAAGAPASARPSWPIAADASPEVVAAAAAVAAAPLQPGSGQLDEVDDRLVADLLILMEDTGADFTNTFRRLSLVPMPPPSSSSGSSTPAADTPAAAAPPPAGDTTAAAAATGGNSSSGSSELFGGFLEAQLPELASPGEMVEGSRPSMPLQQLQMLQMLAGKDPGMLHMLGVNPGTLTSQLARHKKAAAWGATTAAGKASSDASKWTAWLRRYRERLQREADAGVPPELRTAVMAAVNPRLVLRNWVAQTAIRAAELGHYSTVASILQLLRHPYSASGEAQGAAAAAGGGGGVTLTVPPAVAAAAGAAAGAAGAAEAVAAAAGEGEEGGGGSCPAAVELRFDGKPPAWAAKLCVTCSS